MPTQDNAHPNWSSRLLFVLAATGSAVGLGNVWKFPYITGENGGGAFVLVYLLCIAAIGLPILLAEILLGRHGGSSPIAGMRRITEDLRVSRFWRVVGWLGVVSSVVVLSFYSVVGGWALAYVWYAASGRFGAAAESADTAGAFGEIFSGLLADPLALLSWHTAFMALSIFIIARGVREGLEWAVRFLMPGLFVLLGVLVLYSAVATDSFGRGVAFLFSADFGSLSWQGVLIALGHAFFSLSLGLGVMMAYGSYLPRDVSIGRAAVTIGILDTVVALLAGLAIFPMVFAYQLTPGEGPGLIFVTLPIAFGQMPGGLVFGTLFFVFLSVAALTSGLSLLEPAVEHLAEKKGVRRAPAAMLVGGFIWLVGISAALAFNVWDHLILFGKNIFDLMDFLGTNILLPLGGLLIALFVGWVMPRAVSREELAMREGPAYATWYFVLRFISPVAVAGVFLSGLL